ncbi:MAG: lipoate--protein ligase [Bacteroidetes bacterium HGW-Bacteroidetes-6]|jgi:lipoate-protein ligase A|nr:MAG: lipoate--protein ligase [Bacteroidetes bacterium HGW-Bacteroidetes-6]
MQIIELPYRNACQNLAAEEILLKDYVDNFFLIYQNNACVVVGKHQNAMRETNFPFLFENNIPIFRRISGGGTVYHDDGNINFSIIQNTDGENIVDFERYTEPIIQFLKTFNLDAQFGKRHEILVNGYKVSGNAEHIHRKRVLHHGTLLFNTDLIVLEKSLRLKNKKYRDRAVDSVPGNVGNILPMLEKPLSTAEFVGHLVEFLVDSENFSPLSISTELDAKVDKLCSEKYNTWNWNMAYHADYNVIVSDLDSKLSLEFCIEKGKVAAANNLGMDEIYFTELCSLLIGQVHSPSSIDKTVASAIEKYGNQEISLNKIVKMFF